MTLTIRRATAGAAVGALLLALSPAVPAFAATKTTISGTVLDSGGNPVRGVSVVAFNLDDTADDSYVEFSATKADGTFSRARYGQLGPGDWAFVFQDSSDEEVAIEADQTLVTGANTLPTVHLTKGAVINGNVTAPSGTPLKNVDVQFYNQALDVGDPSTIDPSILFSGIGDSFSDVDGSYDVRPLVTGTYDFGISFGEEDFRQLGAVTVSNPGQLVHTDIFNIRVPVYTDIAAKASKSKGKATVEVLVDASYFGIDSPGGSVKVYDGSKKLSTTTLDPDGTASISLSGLKKGKHTLKYTYSGATDTTSATSDKVKVTIK